MSLTNVDAVVFERLKRVYRDKYGGSSGKLVSDLNQANNHVSTTKSDTNIISEKAIRNFFGATQPPRARLQNINLLCRLMLEMSYDEACDRLKSDPPANPASLDSKAEEEHLPAKLDSQSPILGFKEDEYLKELKTRLGKSKFLDTTHELDLDSLYTEVWISESSNRTKFLTINDLMQRVEDIFYRKVEGSQQSPTESDKERLKGLKAARKYQRLIVYGGPGAGKSTLLKYIALHPDQVTEQQVAIPIYIELKDLKSSGRSKCLLEIISEQLEAFSNRHLELTKYLLEESLGVVLLDGLDEVADEDINEVCREIDNLAKRYPKNRFIMTCRVGGCHYNFPGFDQVEISPLRHEQVKKLVQNWFKKKEDADGFLQKLEQHSSAFEFTQNPLLLSLLCYSFQDSFELPRNRYQLYEEVLDVILRRWDSSRRISRSRKQKIFDKISRLKMLDLFSEIAYKGFVEEPQQYFWLEAELEKIIETFIEPFSEAQAREIKVEAGDVLEAAKVDIGLLVERAKKILSFAHLTFQEYLTAYYILSGSDPGLLKKITEKYAVRIEWKEVFIIMAGRMRNADSHLKELFRQADQLVNSPDLQAMLVWLCKVTKKAEVDTASWRAYYLMTDLYVDLYIDQPESSNAVREVVRNLATNLRAYNKRQNKIQSRSDLAFLELSLGAIHTLAFDYSRGTGFSVNNDLITKELKIEGDFALSSKLEVITKTAEKLQRQDLASALKQLSSSLPPNDATSSQWRNWAEDLQKIMIDQLDIGYMVRFSDEDFENLRKYFYLCNLIVESIQADATVSKNVREQLIENLLKPHAQIPLNLLADADPPATPGSLSAAS